MADAPKNYFTGRGTQFNPTNRFDKNTYSTEHSEGIDVTDLEKKTTQYLTVFPKTIVNKVTSPDVGMEYSLNPYQGCEHGCTYCYARPTHEYWGKSAGLDFERVIFIKKNAPDLLKAAFEKKNWKVKPIVLSGNTDCYQPCERQFELTRKLLKIFLAYKHPVGIITKNVLLKRDLDVIGELAQLKLVEVNLSITTLDEELRRKLEPRTATSQRKLALIETLHALNVPVRVMASPIIPGLNDHEILPIAKAAAKHGASRFHAHVVRLMGANEALFEEWLTNNFPDRKSKVLNQLKSIHGGKVGSSSFGNRMKGEGSYALNIRQQREIAKNKYFKEEVHDKLRTDLFLRPGKGRQLDLF